VSIKNLPSNIWESPAIRKRLYQESCFECDWGIADKKQYWAVAPIPDDKHGVATLRNYDPKGILNSDPHQIQQIFAQDVRKMLQSEAGFDGLWVVGYTHPPTTTEVLKDGDNCWGRLFMLWLDEDADTQFTMEADIPFVQMFERGAKYYVGMANEAHETWKEIYSQKVLKEDMGLGADQQKKVALETLANNTVH
jgi:hypothetical protein